MKIKRSVTVKEGDKAFERGRKTTFKEEEEEDDDMGFGLFD